MQAFLFKSYDYFFLKRFINRRIVLAEDAVMSNVFLEI